MPEKKQNDTRIKVYCLLKELSLIQRVKELTPENFNIIMVDNVKAALVCDHENCVVIADEDVYSEIKDKLNSDHSGVIIVCDRDLNLKGEAMSRVPKELFLTDYLDEFIYWTVEKSRYIKEIRMKNKVKSKKIENIIDELHELSTHSVLKKDLKIGN